MGLCTRLCNRTIAVVLSFRLYPRFALTCAWDAMSPRGLVGGAYTAWGVWRGLRVIPAARCRLRGCARGHRSGLLLAAARCVILRHLSTAVDVALHHRVSAAPPHPTSARSSIRPLAGELPDA